MDTVDDDDMKRVLEILQDVNIDILEVDDSMLTRLTNELNLPQNPTHEEIRSALLDFKSRCLHEPTESCHITGFTMHNTPPYDFDGRSETSEQSIEADNEWLTGELQRQKGIIEYNEREIKQLTEMKDELKQKHYSEKEKLKLELTNCQFDLDQCDEDIKHLRSSPIDDNFADENEKLIKKQTKLITKIKQLEMNSRKSSDICDQKLGRLKRQVRNLQKKNQDLKQQLHLAGQSFVVEQDFDHHPVQQDRMQHSFQRPMNTTRTYVGDQQHQQHNTRGGTVQEWCVNESSPQRSNHRDEFDDSHDTCGCFDIHQLPCVVLNGHKYKNRCVSNNFVLPCYQNKKNGRELWEFYESGKHKRNKQNYWRYFKYKRSSPKVVPDIIKNTKQHNSVPLRGGSWNPGGGLRDFVDF